MCNLCKRNGKLKLKVMLALLALVLTLALSACSDQEKSAHNSGSTPSQSEKQNTFDTTENTIMEGDDLVISVADITKKATFYPVVIDGTKIEVIAVEAPDGTVRTAFNTCQVCYDSGRGFYKQVGDMLVCQNCGNQFPMGQVEVEAGGCNPWPIYSKSKIVTDESITISYEFLRVSKEIFANWKSSY